MAGLALLPRLALAQDDDGYNPQALYLTFSQVMQTILISACYLLIYAAALTITLRTLNRFFEVDAHLLTWIGVLWLGGMAANALGYRLVGVHHPFLAGLVALPLIFGWTLFICTRGWTDLLFPAALRVAVVVAVVCAPYFGPTWQVGMSK
jgi:hypothetical protein